LQVESFGLRSGGAKSVETENSAAKRRRLDGTTYAPSSADREDREMMDAIFVIVVVAFFAAEIFYVNACERL
jgi:hypothetical protein